MSQSASRPTINPLRELVEEFRQAERKIREGGGSKAIDRQHEKGRLTARERVDLLVDDPKAFQELGLWCAHAMYAEHGGAPAAGVVTGIGQVDGRPCMIIANDATVKAGAFFPMTCKKIIRAQTIAMMARLPLIYLVDSAGVYLPLQEDVFPDTDDFGRIFRNNAVISAAGIPQIAAIMGYCVAGGGYLPVLCDTLLMTEGSGLYLAGPALVKAAIGQVVTDEELGGATMHASVSGTIDFKEKDDEACIARVRGLVEKYPPVEALRGLRSVGRMMGFARAGSRMRAQMELMEEDRELAAKIAKSSDESEKERLQADLLARMRDRHALGRVRDVIDQEAGVTPERLKQLYEGLVGATESERLAAPPVRDAQDIYSIFTDKPGTQYDVKDIIACVVDRISEPVSPRSGERGADGASSAARSGLRPESGSENRTTNGSENRPTPDFDEYKADYGQSLVCGYARLGGYAVGILANQGKLTERVMAGGKSGPAKSTNMPRVIYDDSADKAARFIMDCNQRKIPLIFLHDTTGFMVGRDSEQGGIIRAGAKMVNAMSNSVVPKIVVIMGGSYGAGNYAMCGRAFDQFLSFAWPNAKCSVMGANQATGVLTTIEEASRKRKGETIDEAAHKAIYAAIHASYTEQQDIRHGAARGWVDRILEPHRTREELIAALEATRGWDYSAGFRTGVLQT